MHVSNGKNVKSTSTKTRAAFIKSMLKYDYFMQGLLYLYLERLENFYFIGVQKTDPSQIFVVDVADYPEELDKALEKIVWILKMKNENNGSYKFSVEG